jgi:hypothetical protein
MESGRFAGLAIEVKKQVDAKQESIWIFLSVNFRRNSDEDELKVGLQCSDCNVDAQHT